MGWREGAAVVGNLVTLDPDLRLGGRAERLAGGNADQQYGEILRQ